MTTGTRLNGRRRNPPAKVGDNFGGRIVTMVMRRDRTSNERVAWRCKHCRTIGSGYVFNLRRVKDHCVAETRKRTSPSESDSRNPAWSKESVYDEQIAPLMSQIIALCKEHEIPIAATFQYANDEDEAHFVSTVVPFDRQAAGITRVQDEIHRIRNGGGGLVAITITSPRRAKGPRT